MNPKHRSVEIWKNIVFSLRNSYNLSPTKFRKSFLENKDGNHERERSMYNLELLHRRTYFNQGTWRTAIQGRPSIAGRRSSWLSGREYFRRSMLDLRGNRTRDRSDGSTARYHYTTAHYSKQPQKNMAWLVINSKKKTVKESLNACVVSCQTLNANTTKRAPR